MKRLLQNVLLAGGSLLAGLVATELLLPLFGIPSIEQSVYEVRRPVVQFILGAYHPGLRYVLQPNLRGVRMHYRDQLDYTVDTNAHGFRGEDWDESAERKNVLVLGDSYAFGWGIEWGDTTGKQLEQRLQKIDPAFQVINLGQSGYSMKEAVRGFELYRERLRPVAAIYIVCQNDLEIMPTPDATGTFPIEYVPSPDDERLWNEAVARNQPGTWTWDRLRRSSYLHAFYARSVRPLLSPRIRASLRTDPAPAGFDFPPPLPSVREVPDSQEKRYVTFCLDRIASTLDGPLLLIPTSDRAVLLKNDTEDNLRWVLADYARGRENATFIDLESRMRLTPDGRKFWLPHDDHWSPAAHRLAAELAFAELVPRLVR